VDDDVSVKELIQRISEDLLESEQERTASGRRAVFEVAELTIELSFVVSRSRQGQGGIDLKVVSVGGQADRADERTQRMTLRLVAAAADTSDDEELFRLDYDDALPVRPRLRQDEE
jgi:Trypsin-co-occurring domain 2